MTLSAHSNNPAAQNVLSQFAATGVQTCFHGRHINPQILADLDGNVGSSRVDLQACKLEYSIVSPK